MVETGNVIYNQFDDSEPASHYWALLRSLTVHDRKNSLNAQAMTYEM